jgi:hypothetical protein
MRKLWATLLATGLMLTMAAPAAAAAPVGDEITVTLSEFCSFDVVIDLTSWQQTRVVKTASDGTTTTIVTGRLVGSVTNDETGKVLPINVPAAQTVIANPDGSLDVRLTGPDLTFMRLDDVGSAFLNFGLVKLHLGDSFTFEPIGHQIDVCAALA